MSGNNAVRLAISPPCRSRPSPLVSLRPQCPARTPPMSRRRASSRRRRSRPGRRLRSRSDRSISSPGGPPDRPMRRARWPSNTCRRTRRRRRRRGFACLKATAALSALPVDWRASMAASRRPRRRADLRWHSRSQSGAPRSMDVTPPAQTSSSGAMTVSVRSATAVTIVRRGSAGRNLSGTLRWRLFDSDSASAGPRFAHPRDDVPSTKALAPA
jgi:hypothetical protein